MLRRQRSIVRSEFRVGTTTVTSALLLSLTTTRNSDRTLRILILNWRYVDHPRAGGAETLTHGILRLLVEQGHEATCFTATYPGAAPEGEIDGVRIVRRGRQWTV